jgi:acetyl-CoA carboxylase carboxyltransferase component
LKKIGSNIKENESFLKRDDYYKTLLEKFLPKQKKLNLAAGKKRLKNIKQKENLTARERINLLAG